VSDVPPDCMEDPKRPYECKSSALLGEWIVDESINVLDKAEKALVDVRGSRGNLALAEPQRQSEARAAYWFFTVDIQKCCITEMRNLRAEALLRLGPRGQDSREVDGWESIDRSLAERNAVVTVYPGEITSYAPYFRALGEKLKLSPPYQ
jgi:hypothetical protein